MNEIAQQSAANEVALAVDIGGTKVRAALIDRRGQLIAATREPTEAARGAAHVLQVIYRSADRLLASLDRQQYPLVGFGVSSAGVIEPATGRVVSAADQIPGWQGQALGTQIAARYQLPVAVDNDANCALIGEVWQGKHHLSAAANVVMLTLGTGLGGALMVHGKLVTGHNHLTGHVGIARMWDPHSKTQVKVEHLVSGTGLENVYRQFVPDSLNGERVTGAQIIERAGRVGKGGKGGKGGGNGTGGQDGESEAVAAIDRWCDHLALQLYNLHWIINPEAIIIGGGMIDAREAWWTQLTDKLADSGVTVPLIAATLGNDAGVYGAARQLFDLVGNTRP